ncbi:MAG: PEP-CTERM sorting domain-containing protein [Planctomycetaceae bacterium]|nr:PEP-CTERM sorting domain-containing protein [Planctomycetaceae bacterium]
MKSLRLTVFAAALFMSLNSVSAALLSGDYQVELTGAGFNVGPTGIAAGVNVVGTPISGLASLSFQFTTSQLFLYVDWTGTVGPFDFGESISWQFTNLNFSGPELDVVSFNSGDSTLGVSADSITFTANTIGINSASDDAGGSNLLTYAFDIAETTIGPVVPEPTSLMLCCSGAFGMCVLRRRKAARA